MLFPPTSAPALRALAGGAASGVTKSSGRPLHGYLTLLTWSFTLFNTVRVLAYLPTLWAIHRSGDSSQHSLWTLLIWLGANVTMAAWLDEQNGQRLNRLVLVNASNAGMCLVSVAVIVGYRL